ncbi:MAG: SDR family oxidoreductase [Acidobacteria bacterium]|nr:SDR family oxidoreductase [Acidobacteriota bacterium]
MNSFRLDRRLALVTGASRGIGCGIARALAGAGADILLAARPSPDLEQAAAQIRALGRRAETCAVDLHDIEGIPAWFDEVVRQHGRPDILVNAAGTTRRAPAESLTMEDWNENITVNLTAVFALCQAFARHSIAAGAKGKIINIASLMVAAARRTNSAYAASKGGLGQLTKALAVDWADKGILVNAITPGYIATKLTEPLWTDPEFDAWVKKRTPLGRWGTPEDLGAPAVFLAAPASDFITGQILFVDGGWISTF